MATVGFQLISNRLLKNLERYSSKRLQTAVEHRLGDIGYGMLDVAFTLVPVLTGYLQSTLYVEVKGMQLRLGATADYAAPVEFGTRFMAAQPYLRPAWDGFIREAERAFKNVIAEAMGLRR